MSRTNIINKTVFVVMLYCFLFAAPFTVMNFSYNGFLIVRLIASFYVVLNWSEFKKFCQRFLKEIQFILLIAVYSLLRGLLSGQMRNPFEDVSAILTLIVMPFFLISYGTRIGLKSLEDLVSLLMVAVSIAVLSSIVAFLVPSVNSFIRESLLPLREDDYIVVNDYRGFGYAIGLVSHYAYTIAFLSVIGLMFRLKCSWFKYVMPFVLIAVLINARTGFIIVVFGLVTLFLRSGSIKTSFVVLILGVLGYTYLHNILESVLGADDRTYSWVMGFFNDAEDYTQGSVSSGAIYTLTHKMIWFPQTIGGWIFGEGYSLFGGAIYGGKVIDSDIGFVNQLFYGGIIYCTLLYAFYFHMIRKLHDCNQKGLSLFLLLTFIVINFKASLFLNTYTFGAIVLLYYGFFIYGSEQYVFPAHPLKVRYRIIKRAI